MFAEDRGGEQQDEDWFDCPEQYGHAGGDAGEAEGIHDPGVEDAEGGESAGLARPDGQVAAGERGGGEEEAAGGQLDTSLASRLPPGPDQSQCDDGSDPGD